MAKYKFAKDGHPYLVHGYEVLNEQGEETRFSTYQFHQRAEILLREAEFPEDESLPREVFYALLVEGDLYNEALPDGIPIAGIPWAMRWNAIQVGNSLAELLDLIERLPPRKKFVLDIYRLLINANMGKALAATKTQLLVGASVLSLARLLKNQNS